MNNNYHNSIAIVETIENAEDQYRNTSRRDISTWLLNHDVPREIVTRLSQLWDKTTIIAGRVVHFGKLVVCKLVEFARRNPNMCTGFAIGLGLSWLLDHIPVIGWLVGPIITATITLACGYYGHLKDRQDGNVITMAQTCFGLIADIAGIITAVDHNK